MLEDKADVKHEEPSAGEAAADEQHQDGADVAANFKPGIKFKIAT